MLKTAHALGYPKEYHDFYCSFNDRQDGKTLRNFVSSVESLSEKIEFPDDDAKLKFKGDMLEILSEIFFCSFENDEAVGLRNYEPVLIGEDYGVDATGINPNNDKVAVQVKYRSNILDPILYEDVAKTFCSGLLNLQCDVTKPNSIYVFTTSNITSKAMDKVLGNRVRVLNFDVISRKIDNNHSFWLSAYDMIFKFLDQ